MRRAAVIPALFLALAIARPARATPPLEEMGYGARGTALAGARVATADGTDGAFYNPAAVALAAGPSLTLGYGWAQMALQLDGRDAGVTSPHGLSLATALPVALGPRARAALGVALYLPDQFIARLQLTPATEPHYLLLGNNPDRLLVNTVLAVAPTPWLSLGAGITVLSDAAGNGVTFNVGGHGTERVATAALDVSLPTRAAPIAGVLVRPTRRLSLGAAYQGEIDLGIRFDVLVNVDVPGVVTGDTLLALRAVDYYTPERYVLGAAYDAADRLRVSAQVDWLRWSGFHGGAPDARVLVNLGIAPPLVQSLLPPDNLHDTVIPRLGLEYHARLASGSTLAVRAGYAYVPTPVPPQTGLTSYADTDRHVIAVGGGFTFVDPTGLLAQPIAIDAALQLHALVRRATIKDPRAFPGGGFTASGDILGADVSATVRF